MWAGFYVNAASGVVLFFLDARAFATNPVFWIKLASIVGALAILRRLLAGLSDFSAAPGSSRQGTLARALFVFWAVAVTAGRLTAYDPFIQESAIAVLVAMVALFLVVRYLAAGAMNFDATGHAADGSRIDSVARPPARV